MRRSSGCIRNFSTKRFLLYLILLSSFILGGSDFNVPHVPPFNFRHDHGIFQIGHFPRPCSSICKETEGFNVEEEANIQQLLTDDPSFRKVTSRGIDFQKQRFVHLANKIFKFNGWSYSVSKENIDFVEFNDSTYKVGVCAWVKVLLKDGSFREDIGYGFYESVLKGNAIQNARKLAGADALIETLKGLGNAFNYLSADMSGQVNSPVVRGDSSSETQTDAHEPRREVERPPPIRRRGRKRKNHILSSSSARQIDTTLVSKECEEPGENVIVQSSDVQTMPFHTRFSTTNYSSQACEESGNNYVEHHSSAATVFQPTCVPDESTSEAPAELPDLYREVKRVPTRGRRGRRRKGGRTAFTFCRRKRSHYIPQEAGKDDESIVIPSTQVEAASDCPKIVTDGECEELKKFQNELDAKGGNIPEEREGTPASGSTNTADESPTDTSYVAMVSTDWRCGTSTCNSQTSNVESMYSVIRTDSSNQSCEVQLQRVDFAYVEEKNPSPNVVISQSSSLPYSMCKTEALDLSSSSAPSSQVGYHPKSTATSKKVIAGKTKKNISQLC